MLRMDVTFGFLTDMNAWGATVPGSLKEVPERVGLVNAAGSDYSIQARQASVVEEELPQLNSRGSATAAQGAEVEIYENKGEPLQTFLYWKAGETYLWVVVEGALGSSPAAAALLTGLTIQNGPDGSPRVALGGSLQGVEPTEPIKWDMAIYGRREPSSTPWSVGFARTLGAKAKAVNTIGDVTIVTIPASPEIAVVVNGSSSEAGQLQELASDVAGTVGKG